jgi:tetratricopeptide (TPR) repeat protein
MAPEQVHGHADERTDQFGLCAAFYEALWDERPYRGHDRASLFENLEAGRLVAPPTGIVPEHVRRTLLRGLSPDPAGRFPSVDALLLALDRGRNRRRRWIAIGCLASASVAGWLALASARPSVAPCAVDEAALDHAWGQARRAEVERAVSATGVPHAGATWSRLVAELDQRAADWSAATLASCRAARDPDPEVAALGAARLACNAGAIATFEAATAALASVDEATVQYAVPLGAVLADLMDCNAASSVDGDEGLHLAVAVASAELERRLTRFGRAEELAVQALETTTPGELPRLRARAQLVVARIHADRNEAAAERAALRAALADAESAADGVLLAETWEGLAFDAARGHDEDAARFYLDRAVQLARDGRLDERSVALTLRARGLVEQELGRPKDAVDALAQALARFDALGDGGYEYAGLMMQYAQALEYADRVDEAIAVGEQGLSRYEELLGEDHPLVAVQRIMVGRMYSFVGDEPRVERELLRALGVLEANPRFRPDVRVALYDDLAQTYANLLRLDDALATSEQAIALQRELDGGVCGFGCVRPMLTNGRILLQRDDRVAALAVLDESLRHGRGVTGTVDDVIGEVQLLRAEVLALLRRPNEARSALAEAAAALGRVYHDDSGFGLQTTQKIGHIEGLVGDVDAARATLRGGIERATIVGALDYVGRMHWELGLLHARAGEVVEARAEFETARAAYVQARLPEEIIEEIDGYIRKLSG